MDRGRAPAWYELCARRPRATALAGATCLAFTAILYRLSAVSPTTATVFRCAYALPLLWPWARHEDRTLGKRPPASRRLALIAGVLFAADLVAWQDAILAIGAGLATVIANMQVVIVALLGWILLKDRPAPGVLVAIPLLVIGTVGVSGVLDRGAYGSSPGRGVASGIAAALCYAGYLLLMRQGNPDRRLAGPLLDATATASLGGLVAGVVAGNLSVRPSWPAHGWLALMALTSQIAGYGLVTLSLPRLPPASASALLMAQPVATLLLAAVILGEWPSTLQILGTGCILVGLAVVIAPPRRWAGSSQTERRHATTREH